jgi:hypothetical protein
MHQCISQHVRVHVLGVFGCKAIYTYTWKEALVYLRVNTSEADVLISEASKPSQHPSV